MLVVGAARVTTTAYLDAGAKIGTLEDSSELPDHPGHVHSPVDSNAAKCMGFACRSREEQPDGWWATHVRQPCKARAGVQAASVTALTPDTAAAALAVFWGYGMELSVLCRSTWGTQWTAFTHLSLVDTPNIWCGRGMGRGRKRYHLACTSGQAQAADVHCPASWPPPGTSLWQRPWAHGLTSRATLWWAPRHAKGCCIYMCRRVHQHTWHTRSSPCCCHKSALLMGFFPLSR